MPELPLERYLTRTADEIARRLIAPQLAAFLAEDRGRGATLQATIGAWCDADLSLKGAAARLGVHANTVVYRLTRVRELAGLDPRHVEDLCALRLAIAITAT